MVFSDFFHEVTLFYHLLTDVADPDFCRKLIFVYIFAKWAPK